METSYFNWKPIFNMCMNFSCNVVLLITIYSKSGQLFSGSNSISFSRSFSLASLSSFKKWVHKITQIHQTFWWFLSATAFTHFIYCRRLFKNNATLWRFTRILNIVYCYRSFDFKDCFFYPFRERIWLKWRRLWWLFMLI